MCSYSTDIWNSLRGTCPQRHECVPSSRSSLFFFPVFCRMKDRKINSKFWCSRSFNSVDFPRLRRREDSARRASAPPASPLSQTGAAFHTSGSQTHRKKKELSFPFDCLSGFSNTASEKLVQGRVLLTKTFCTTEAKLWGLRRKMGV